MKLTVKRAGTSDDVPLWESAAEAWPDHDGMIYAYGQVLGDEHWMHFPGLASFRFNSRGDDVAAGQPRVVSLPFQPRLRKPSADLFAVKTANRTVPGYEMAPVGTHTAEMGMVC